MDGVFFCCEQQTIVGPEAQCKDTSKKIRNKDEDSSSDSNSKKVSCTCNKNSEKKGCLSNVNVFEFCQFSRKKRNTGQLKKNTYLPKYSKNPFGQSQKNVVHRSVKNSFGQNQKKSDSEITHKASVDIQVEDYRQSAVVEMSIVFLSDSASANKDVTNLKGSHNQPKISKRPLTAQSKCNLKEQTSEPNSTKNIKQRCHKSSTEIITKGKKSDEYEVRGVSEKKHLESTKKFLWGSKSSKSVNKADEKSSKEQSKIDPTEKQLKNKKLACSPLKRLGRSSLTIEPDKMKNLSKYSPCASRLAAGSKILCNDIAANLESPLHVARSRSPSHVDIQTESSTQSSEKTSMQASLSLNMQQFQKARYAPRSRSVGDSCVTSPTSEATTISYSPTATEVLSLEEVGQQTSSTEGSGSYSEVKEKLDVEYSDKVRRATLETKC